MEDSGKTCELCGTDGGTVLWQSSRCRVVRVADAHYPGFCRVIWTAHAREMTDLGIADRQYLMAVVFAVEAVIRALFNPDKINLASFGNMVPHVHWHVIPRWRGDRHFPEPIWGSVQHDEMIVRPSIDDSTLTAAVSTALANVSQ